MILDVDVYILPPVSGDDTSMVWRRGHPNVRQAKDILEEATAVNQYGGLRCMLLRWKTGREGGGNAREISK